MSRGGRLAIYAAILGGAWLMTSGRSTTPVRPAVSTDQRHALLEKPMDDRQELASLPVLPAPLPEPPPAAPREPVVRTTRLYEDFAGAARLTDDQRIRFEVATTRWSEAIDRLAHDAVARKWPTPYVSEKAHEIQGEYEASLRSFMDVTQMAVFGEFHARGLIGVYAIELPVDDE